MSDRIIGASPRRGGGYERVTGQQQYVADIRLPDMLYVRLVTIDSAHARIGAIHTERAEEVPGVHVVMTAADLPQPVPRFGPQFEDRPVIAVGEVKYHGEPVAAVAAESPEAADEAARLVRVDYEELRAVFTLPDALAADAPLVQDPSLRKDDRLAKTNVLSEHRYEWGDVDSAEADLIVEGSYAFPMISHFAIEPHGFMAAPDGDGIAVWSSMQHPYWLQRTLAKVLDLPLSRVRVLAPDPGGGFGGKQHVKFEPLVAFMALRVGRPVRLILSLEESFQAARRTLAEVHVRTGFNRDGTITFRDLTADYLLGAYADIADRVVGKGVYPGNGPYRVPASRTVARSVLSHTPPSTAMRGFGAPQVIWAVESNLDEAARQLGLDGLEIRLRNLAHRGDKFIPTDLPADGDWPQAVHRAAELIEWDSPLPAGHGRGISVGIKLGPTTGLSYATVRFLGDGSVLVYAGTSDMGQGARTVFAQICAHELGVELERVNVISGDTFIVPYDQQTSASRSTVLMGNAVLDACHRVHAQLRVMAARLHRVDESQVEIAGGVATIGDETVPLPELLVAGLGRQGGEVIGNGMARKEAEAGHPLGGSATFYEFNCTAVEAAVDAETGEVTIHRHATVSDVGRALNPLQVRMQDEGAAIQGLGHSLMEHLILDEAGRIRNLGAIDYRIPTVKDMPIEMVSDMIENSDGPGPYGAKGMSEGGLLCVAPAVAAAVYQASGAIVRDLPLTPQRVWEALHELRPAREKELVS